MDWLAMVLTCWLAGWLGWQSVPPGLPDPCACTFPPLILERPLLFSPLLQLRQLWADTQRPEKLHSDNGLEFDGAVARLCVRLGIKRAKGRPYRPQTQGLVERTNATVKSKLRAALRDNPGCEWPDLLAMVQEQINSSPNRALDGQAPTHVLFGQHNRLHRGEEPPEARWASRSACLPACPPARPPACLRARCAGQLRSTPLDVACCLVCLWVQPHAVDYVTTTLPSCLLMQ